MSRYHVRYHGCVDGETRDGSITDCPVCSSRPGRANSYQLPNSVLYEVDDDTCSVQTIFSDGACCNGVAQFTDDDEERARSLGYEGGRHEVCWAMHRDHDLIHTIVAQAEGQPWSPTLYYAAHGLKLPPGLGNREERLVFLVTRALNVGGVLPEALLS